MVKKLLNVQNMNIITCKHEEVILLRTIRFINIVRCNRCQLILTQGSLVQENSSSIYLGSFEHRRKYDKYIKPSRLLSYRNGLDKLESYRKLNRIIDIGCSYGYFLAEAKRRGWEAFGVEISKYEAGVTAKEVGIPVWEGNLEYAKFPTGYFDVVTMWDVIEHIPNPVQLLLECNRILRKNGVILIRTPNAEALSMKCKWYAKPVLWSYLQLAYPSVPKEHLYHFTPSTIDAFMRNTGFETLQIITKETLGERMLKGPNIIHGLLRRMLSYIAWKLDWPFEMVIIAEKKEKNK